MIRFILFCVRLIVGVILMGVALVLVVGVVHERGDLEGGKVPSEGSNVKTRPPLADWGRRESESKRKLVGRVPELGLPRHALREEFDRRARLFRSVNPAFFDSPEWPEQLWALMARDLSLEEPSMRYPWKRDGMGSARP